MQPSHILFWATKISSVKVVCHVESKDYASLFRGLEGFAWDGRSYNFTVRVEKEIHAEVIKSVANCTVVPEPVRADALAPDEFFQDYQSYATLRETLAGWARQHPLLATFVPSIGKTHEGRDIFAFRIATNGCKKSIWFNGGLHAREWISPAATIYLIHRLLKDAETARVKRLLATFDFHFTPLANPDGYEFSRQHDRMWRKNRRENGDGTVGVDLNRNWDDHWGAGSEDSNNEVYQGRHAHSEPEIQALANYSLAIPRGYGGIDFHSYGQMILRNWAWTGENSTNEATLRELSHEVRRAFATKGQDYSVVTAQELYSSTGTLMDWMASKAKLVALTIELCPTHHSMDDFVYPTRSIVSCCEGAYAAALAFAEFLLEHPNIPHNTRALGRQQ